MKVGDLVRFIDTDRVDPVYWHQVGLVVGYEEVSDFPGECWNILIFGHVHKHFAEGIEIELYSETG